MNRGMLVACLMALCFVVGAVIFCPDRRPTGTTDLASSGSSASAIPDQEKTRIRDFWSLYREAQSLKLEGSWPQAVEIYERALELDPEHEDSLYGLANCCLEMNDFREALQWLHRLVEINPMSLRGHLQIGMIRTCPLADAEFDLDAAEAALQRAFEINQEETGSLLRLGEVALLKGDHERAYERFSLANRSNFRAVEGYYLRAYVRWKEKRSHESRELLREAVHHAHAPKVVAAAPAEGDTRPGSSLPPTTLEEKMPLRRFWSDLAERYPTEAIELDVLDAEFGPIDVYLKDLRVRLVSASR